MIQWDHFELLLTDEMSLKLDSAKFNQHEVAAGYQDFQLSSVTTQRNSKQALSNYLNQDISSAKAFLKTGPGQQWTFSSLDWKVISCLISFS